MINSSATTCAGHNKGEAIRDQGKHAAKLRADRCSAANNKDRNK